MGKVLKILGIVFLVIIALFVVLLFWSHGKGQELQEKFCTAIGTGDAAKVMELMDSRLLEEVDEPVLKMWMDEVNAKLGKYKQLSKSSAPLRIQKGKTPSSKARGPLFSKMERRS